MKKTTLLLFFCLFIMSCQPSSEFISGSVQKQLQQKIDTAFAGNNGSIKVSKVVVVRETDNKYAGVAEIVAYGTPISLKLTILADKNNTIYETTTADWEGFVASAFQQKIKPVEGKYSDIAAKNEIVFSSFPDSLKRDKQIFVERLGVVSLVTLESDYWFGTGCRSHDCGNNEAAWAINRNNGKGYAVILSQDAVAGNEPTSSFSVYGSEPKDLPPPLLKWAIEQGMKQYNFVTIQNSAI